MHTRLLAGAAALLLGVGVLGVGAHATIVEIDTSVGKLQINLYDETTPKTVANFLAYVDSKAYDGTFIHRSIPGFMGQGGGFSYGGLDSDMNPIITEVTTTEPVTNEPVYSNVRGTIAMAKLGTDPNSATSQWFINYADNSSNLDRQNAGFTVFGEVVDGYMGVVDALEALDTWNFGSPFTDLPLQNFSVADYDAYKNPDETSLIQVSSIVVVDSAVNSAAGLNPPVNYLITDLDDDGVLNEADTCPNTAANAEVDENGCSQGQLTKDNGNGDGGGSSSLWLFALLGLGLLRRK